MTMARVCGPGHPDTVCDLVAATIVEEYVRRDPHARTDIRVSGGHGVLFVAGEVCTSADFDVSSVVRRTVALCGVSESIEPFITIEPMAPAWALAQGSRVPSTVFGYATHETKDRVPHAVFLARLCARAMEQRRLLDPDWYWLGSDYDVWVDTHGSSVRVFIRAEHAEAADVSYVRTHLSELVQSLIPEADMRINPAGAETVCGFSIRMGSSGRKTSVDQYGSLLPATPDGTGREPSHPLLAGTWMARSLARTCVDQGMGKAIMVRLSWLPMESKPFRIQVRNEQGSNVSIPDLSFPLDLAAIPEPWRDPVRMTDDLRFAFDESISLPWEKEQ